MAADAAAAKSPFAAEKPIPDFLLNKFALELDKPADANTSDDLFRITKLDLAGTKITDLTPLERLTGLHSLDLGVSPVRDLTPLAGLKNVGMVLSSAQNVKVPKELEGRVRRV